MHMQTETCRDLQRLTEAGRDRQRDARSCTQIQPEIGRQIQTEAGRVRHTYRVTGRDTDRDAYTDADRYTD